MVSTKNRIMELLQWNEEQYANFQYKTGCQYLQSYIPNDPAGIDQLVESKIFWAWWKNHWLQRDEDFLNNAEVKDATASGHVLITMYEVMHDPYELTAMIRPHSLILSETYGNMIGKLIDDKICQ